ncbi:pirin family protein [Methylocucumis oryzae]|uniref:Quercetin 2,3-dioxygenase n=1 Tax=Methylocucumis oryzae TaxID=1632867 RepID=A0A0F3IF75_9GAMM|nr:pirin family protein [Methylocucumis oryzae]KJV05337.1 quercetin 2,3-dioxygenase [Methylocucumis oryzae]
MNTRTLQQFIPAIAMSDGGGVKLLRSLGQNQTLRVDPFLMLDEFCSANPDDYIAGFPSHPHRGFETVTYMLEGHMLHEDHLGNKGNLKSGGAQWMTAGRGIIHSEMPQQESGRMRGFQLWINLPAKEKMKPAHYQDIQPEQIPLHVLPDGGDIKVIAGCADIGGSKVYGPIQSLSTEPLFLDVRLPAQSGFSQTIAEAHNAFIYPYEGTVAIGMAEQHRILEVHTAGVLSNGEQIVVRTTDQSARFLLLAGRPLREPVVQYGPFVMNTREEIEQAMSDYKNGQLA